jgi:mRNA-degrading endonuclease RelE of RelBE toxin-antitoxin system
MRDYRPYYSHAAAEFFVSLSKRRQRKLLETCNQLARSPFVRSDYTVKDSDGRPIEHIRIGGFVVPYWVDHPVCKVMVVEIEDVG